MQKSVVGALLAIAVCIAVHEARRSSGLSEEIQILERHQASLTDELGRLRREHAQATNQLASIKEEIARLQSQQNSPELLKLKGQIGVLHRQLAVLKAQAGTNAVGFSRMLTDPRMREYIRQNQMEMAQVNLKDLFKELKLSPEQTQKAVETLSALFLKNAEKMYSIPQGTLSAEEVSQATAERERELLEQLKPLLGDGGGDRFMQYMKEMPAHASVDLLNGRLGGNQLIDEQNTRLFQIIKAEAFELTRGVAGDWDPAFWGTQEYVDNHLLQVAESNQRILEQASSFLSADQLSGLNNVLTNGINSRIAQAAALISKP